MHSQNLDLFFVQSQTVVEFILLPAFEIDDQVNLRLQLNRTHAEQLLHINDTDTAQLNIVANQFGCFADKLIRHTANFHRVIRHQTMAALDQLNGSFTLTNTTLARDENTFTVDIEQNTVARDTRCEGLREESNHIGGKVHRGFLGMQNGTLILPRHIQTLREDIQIAGNDQRRNPIGKEIFKTLFALLRCQSSQHLCLSHTDDL